MAHSGSGGGGSVLGTSRCKSLPSLQTDPKAFFLNESCLTNLILNDFNFSLVFVHDTSLSGLLLWSFPFHLQICRAS